MPGEKASINLLLQRLNSSKATYLESLDEVHEALAKSLLSQDRVTGMNEEEEAKLAQPHQDPEVITESDPDAGVTSGNNSNLNETERRDPLSEEAFFSEKDLEAFVDSLDSQLELRHLSPTTTGKGFFAVVFRRGLKKNKSLKDEILKFLEHLSSLQLTKESRQLSRIHSPGNHWKDQGGHHHIGSHNAAWFAYLDDNLAEPWTLFHEDIDLTDPPNFWEILRRTAPPTRQQVPCARVIVTRVLNADTILSLLVTLRAHLDIGGMCSALFSDESEARSRYDLDEGDRHMVQSWLSIPFLSIRKRNMFPWDEQGPLYEEVQDVSINRQHTVIALTTWEHLDPKPSWLLLILSTNPQFIEGKYTRPKSTNGSCEYFERIASEFRKALFEMESVSDAIWDVGALPRDFLFDKDTRERFLFEDAQFTHARRYFWALQALNAINDNFKQLIDTWKLYRKQFESNERLSYFLNKLSSQEISAVSEASENVEAILRSMMEQIEKNNERKQDIIALRDGLLSTSRVMESRLLKSQGETIGLMALASMFLVPYTVTVSVIGITHFPRKITTSSFLIAGLVFCVPTCFVIATVNSQIRKIGTKSVQWIQDMAIGLGWRHRHAGQQGKRE